MMPALSRCLHAIQPPRRKRSNQLALASLYNICSRHVIKQLLPGLAFSDDLVLMADNVLDMRVLLIACEAKASRLQLLFNTSKFAVVLVSGQGEDLNTLSIQKTVLPVDTKHKHLWVTMTNSEDYLAEHHENVKA